MAAAYGSRRSRRRAPWIALDALALSAAKGLFDASLSLGASLLTRPKPTRRRPAARKPVRAALVAQDAQDALERAGWKRAVVKTVSFRVIVATLDFSANYFVLGNVALAAGLTTFSVVAGPLFYFLHEAGWNYFGAEVPADDPRPVRVLGVSMSRALGKTITYRTVATIAEFSGAYIVVGDLATAAILSSFGFVLGPFVYFAHEKVWERFETPLLAPPARLAHAG